MSTDAFAAHCREIARRFLLTAVVVDDELSVSTDEQVHSDLTRPDDRTARRAQTSVDPDRHPPRPLRVVPITRSFVSEGMVCGVVSPEDGESDREDLAKAVSRADIVVLDWRLNPKSGANALPLLQRILAEDRPDRLRLIAFYTGESDHEKIRGEIVECLNGVGGGDQAKVTGSGNAIDFRSCRMVVYGKPEASVVDPGTVVAERELADQLITDFAGMVEGLLPSLVLTALGAVRENVHRVLDCFGRDLDPAFLVHRACLPQPPESEQHIVEQIASELHGIMDDAVAQGTPAGIGAIEQWLLGRFGNRGIELAPRKEGAAGKPMPHDEVLAMLERGIEAEPGSLKKNGKEFDLLSHGFSDGAVNSREIDRRLAAAMSLRQVPPGTWRQLSMGAVVILTGSDEADPLLCVTPRCDSVRLTDTTRFLFVPLTDAKPNTLQIVLPVAPKEHRRMTISLNPSQWRSVGFVPDSDRQCVLAQRNGTDQPFTFKAACGREYRWVGELKPEFAQSMGQAIAERMSRIPLNRSEWLRRSERVG